MATFQITAPDGAKYQITAPDDATDEQIQNYVQTMTQAPIPEGYDGPAPKAPYEIPMPPKGNDSGPGNAFVYGLNQIAPFSKDITAGIGAGIAKLAGAEEPVSELYNMGRADINETLKQNPKSALAGNLAGIAEILPLAFNKVIIGAMPTTRIRGTINAIPGALSQIGSFVRGGEIAKDAGALSKLGNLALQSGKGAVVAVPSGALYGAGEAEPGKRLQGAISGAELAAATGGAIPVAGAAARGVKEAVLPTIEDAIKPLAQRARDLGIPLRLDQVSPTRVRNTVQKVSQEIPLSGSNVFEDKQRQAFNAAIAKTIGQDAKDLSPEVINKFLDDASVKFNGAIKGKTVNFDDSDFEALNNIVSSASDDVTGDVAELVGKNASKITNDIAEGVISGEKLSSLRSSLIKRLPKIDSQARPYVAEMVDVIDNAVQRSVPESVETLKTARREWRNYKTLLPLLEKSTDGNINPTQLLNRVANNPYINASRTPTGQDDLVDLARIGKQLLFKKGGSDTAQKTGAIIGSGSVIGSLATLNPVPALLAGGTVAANRGLQGLNTNQRIVDAAIRGGFKTPTRALLELAKKEPKSVVFKEELQ